MLDISALFVKLQAKK